MWWAAAALAAIVIVNIVVERFVLRRLEQILAAMHNLSLGKRSAPLSEKYADEVGQVSLTFNEMVMQIEKRNAENEQLSQDLQRQNTERGELLGRIITVQEDERARVARDLHDELGQALAGLSLRTEAIKRLVSSNPEQALAVLDETQGLVHSATEQMYNLILALRPSVLDDMGLVAALRLHAERTFKGAGIQFQLDASELATRLPAEVETALFRIFQEAMNNVVRHAHAKHVFMVLSLDEGLFRGEVSDNGIGFDYEAVRSDAHKPRGLGLLGMQERVMKYRGKIEVFSSPEEGTRIVILIPLEEAVSG
jgi:signal transduction histidine kinase